MKFMIYAGFLVVAVNTMAMETKKGFKDYPQDDLIATRLAWAFQEDRLGQLKYEAKELASRHKVDYFSGDKFVAVIDANNNTITTNIEHGKTVTLSYEDFSKLLSDETICQLANQRICELANQRLETNQLLQDFLSNSVTT